ncbi:glycosyltransferase family 4 protein [Candidatus Sumerlaeota bacterium]|nr:glycosyltransferase family 4 protein [Candidatus Sumerlaeota bacterium]
MKIFQINMHRAWGGQPNRVLTESLEVAKRGHEVWIAGPRDCELVQRARRAGLPVFDDLRLRRGLRPRSFLRDIATLRRLFARERFDLIHTHGSQDTWVCALATRKMRPRIPIVRSRHNTFAISGNLFNRWLYRHCIDHVVTISPQVNDYLVSKNLMSPGQITAIYSVPDPERFAGADPTGAREEFGFGPDDEVVVSAARLAPEKGHVHLVEAAAILREEFPHARYLFAGTGRSRPEIEARIARHGLEGVVVLAGFRHDVPRLLAMSDIFCLSPVGGESLGTAILEGFLMKLPAVATDVGGVCESVRDGETGFLVPPGDPEALANGLRNLLADPDLRKRFGDAGHRMVHREFTLEQLGERTEKVYRDVLAWGKT